MKNKTKEEIRKIYTSDYLNEDKIRALFDLLEEQYQQGAKDMLKLISIAEAWEESEEYYYKKFFKGI